MIKHTGVPLFSGHPIGNLIAERRQEVLDSLAALSLEELHKLGLVETMRRCVRLIDSVELAWNEREEEVNVLITPASLDRPRASQLQVTTTVPIKGNVSLLHRYTRSTTYRARDTVIKDRSLVLTWTSDLNSDINEYKTWLRLNRQSVDEIVADILNLVSDYNTSIMAFVERDLSQRLSETNIATAFSRSLKQADPSDVWQN